MIQLVDRARPILRGMKASLVIILSALTLASCRGAGAPDIDAGPAIDHIVIGVANLDAGVRDFEQRTGIRPVFGGEHPHSGTHNALVALGDRDYIEIVAPRPGADLPPRMSFLAGLTKPTPVMWAVRTTDVAKLQRKLEDAGYTTSGPMPGSRRRPDGVELAWTTLAIVQPGVAGAPFFIEWAKGSPHPAQTSPPGCQLGSFRITVRDPEPLRRLLEVVGLAVAAEAGSPPAYEVDLDTPRGNVRVGSK